MKHILYNGTFLTMEQDEEAEAILMEDGRIKGVGTKEQMLSLAPEAALLSMEGHTVLPGFIDGHSHISAVAYQLLMANLKPSPTGECDSVEAVVEELKRKLGESSLNPGEWLLGMGYDNSVYPDQKHPTKEDLDLVSTEVPIAAIHISGHLCVVNSLGLELMGYTGDSFYVPSGGIVEPTGLLKEQAFLSSDKIGRPSVGDTFLAVGEASKLYSSYGITTVHDGKTMAGEMGLLKAAGEQGLLKNDVVCYLAPELAEELLPRQSPDNNLYSSHLRMAGIKLFLDGSPQGKTAWLSQPYEQAPEGETADYRGFPVQTEDYVMEMMKKSIHNRWQMNIHANGDEAIEQMIRCYTLALKETGSAEELRPVVIHCQTVREDQLMRMKEIGMIASFFLDHVYYWGDYHYESVLGPERASRISPLKSALNHGISFTLHQDSPVVPPDVIASIHNAVNRQTRSGRILGAEQRITVKEALRAVTIGGAYQIFEEGRKGSIAPGKVADLVVLDRNPLQVPVGELKEIKVLETIKDGAVVFRTDHIL